MNSKSNLKQAPPAVTKSGLPRISDRAPKMNLSRQGRWQREHIALGLCVLCSKPAIKGKCHCDLHRWKTRQRYLKNQKKKKAYARKYYARNRAKMLEYGRAWRAANPDYMERYNKAITSSQQERPHAKAA